MALVAAGHAGLAERHQHLAIGAELDDLMAELSACLCGHRDRVLTRGIGRPHVAFAIDVQPVRPDEHPGTEALDDVALCVEFVDRVDVLDAAVRVEAVDAEAPAVGNGHRIGLIASDEGPDAFSVDVHVHRRRRSHLASARQPRPVAAGHHQATAIRQSLHGTIRIRQPALRECHRSRDQKRPDARCGHRSNVMCLQHGSYPTAPQRTSRGQSLPDG